MRVDANSLFFWQLPNGRFCWSSLQGDEILYGFERQHFQFHAKIDGFRPNEIGQYFVILLSKHDRMTGTGGRCMEKEKKMGEDWKGRREAKAGNGVTKEIPE